jgi:hypothetical protein
MIQFQRIWALKTCFFAISGFVMNKKGFLYFHIYSLAFLTADEEGIIFLPLSLIHLNSRLHTFSRLRECKINLVSTFFDFSL